MLTNTFSFENGYLIQIDDILAKKPAPVPPEPVPPTPEDDPIEKVNITTSLTGIYLQLTVSGDLSTLDHYEINAYANNVLAKSFNNGKDTTFDLNQVDSSVPTGDYIIECVAVSTYGNNSPTSNSIDYTALPAPAAMTLRFEFSNPDYSPVDAEVGTSGTWNKLNAKNRNIWDWTNTDTSWASAFTIGTTDGQFVDYENNKVSVLSCGDLSSVTVMSRLFAFCSALIAVYKLDTSGANDVFLMFNNCTNLAIYPDLDFSKVTDCRAVFQSNLAMISAPNIKFPTDHEFSLQNFFLGCDNLMHIPTYDTRRCNSMRAFLQAHKDRALDMKIEEVPMFDTSNVTAFNMMFAGCTKLKVIPNYDTSSGTNFHDFAIHCQSLKMVPNLDYSHSTDMEDAFYDCTSLTFVPDMELTAATNISGMFAKTPNVTEGALALFNKLEPRTASFSKYNDVFYKCGINTESGLAELEQIPQYWGGLAEG